MHWKIFYFDEVKHDIRESRNWYEYQQQGTGERFTADIKAAIKRLKNNPAAYEIRYRNIRVCYPLIFPYAIHFYLDEAMRYIIIVAITHQERDPVYSKRRI